jgi:hypothetical protein
MPKCRQQHIINVLRLLVRELQIRVLAKEPDEATRLNDKGSGSSSFAALQRLQCPLHLIDETSSGSSSLIGRHELFPRQSTQKADGVAQERVGDRLADVKPDGHCLENTQRSFDHPTFVERELMSVHALAQCGATDELTGDDRSVFRHSHHSTHVGCYPGTSVRDASGPRKG